MKQFLDNAEKGFIYVSLGTNAQWEDMPNNALETFSEAFSALPYKVVWKMDPDTLLKKYENILVSKWLPQQSILGNVMSLKLKLCVETFVVYLL